MTASEEFEYTGLVGEKQGVFKHKNTFGGIAALSFLFALYFLNAADAMRKYLLFFSFMCLLLANSATKIFAIIGIIVFVRFVYFVGGSLLSKYYKLSLYFAMFLMASFVFVSINMLEYLLGVAGKDLSFTGRVVIWEHALDIAQDRIAFGYGLSSIWATDLGYIPELPFYIPIHSHNSFVEVLLTSGIVGVFLLLMFVVSSLVRFSGFMNLDGKSKFFLSVIMLTLIDSFFEFTLFRGNSILFLFFMFSIFHMRFRSDTYA